MNAWNAACGASMAVQWQPPSASIDSLFSAAFDIDHVAAGTDGEETTDVLLDAQIKAKQLPPPPFKGMVKGILQQCP